MDGDTQQHHRRVLTFQRGPLVLRFVAVSAEIGEDRRINALIADPKEPAVFIAFVFASVDRSRLIRGSATQRDAIWIDRTSFDVSREEGIRFEAWMRTEVQP